MHNVVFFFVAVFLAIGVDLLGATRTARATDALSFPRNFRWCVATSAHQIEGYNTESDWWEWEHTPGKIKNGETSGPACDHWNRVWEDVGLLKELGVRQYRFSVEWAKIEPREGFFDPAALAHYQYEIGLLLSAGIKPMVTLHHFTNPRWFAAQGGWLHPDAPQKFARFAAVVFHLIGGGVEDWITFNEPMVILLGGYLKGLTPPGRQSIADTIEAMRGMLKSHALAYQRLHALARLRQQKIRIGVAKHLRVFAPDRPDHPLDRTGAKLFDRLFNWAFLDALETGVLKLAIPFVTYLNERIPGLEKSQDILGINYYSRDHVRFAPGSPLFMELKVPKGAPVTDLGWEIHPDGLLELLRELGRRYPGKDIFITENGLADRSDTKRVEFTAAHLRAVHRAISEGLPVKGYCHWSLMDNFEWLEGFEPRFGLYEVDYRTFERKARPSARWYRDVIRRGGF